MDANQWERVKSLFEQAIALPTAERSAFLDEACCDADPELRREVEELLRGDRLAEADGRLSTPVLHWPVQNRPLPHGEDTGSKAPSLPRRIGSYRILQKLSPGGMGEIYLASDDRLKRKVVIKLLPPDAPPENVKRFEEEQRILAHLNHPNIVAIYGTGSLEGDGRRYFVMEFVEGEDLKTYRQRVGSLPPADVVGLARQVAAALDAAHQRGVIHRDVKPANIMVAREDEAWRVKVLDFGIAVRQRSEGETTRDKRRQTGPRDYTAGIIGTWEYLSPEQAAGLRRDQIDGRADIYPLGVVIYELLTGRRPFYSNDPDILLQQHLDKLPVPPSRVNRNIRLPARLDSAVLRALEKMPADRFETAGAFAEALAASIRSSPRRPTSGGLLIMTAALLLILGGIIGYQLPGTQPDAGQTQVIDQGQVMPAPTSTPIAAPPPGTSSESAPGKPLGEMSDPLPLTLFRIARDGERRQVNADYVFRSGDGLRLVVTPLREGYLYLIQAGSSGRVQILYPDRRISRGNHRVNAGQRLEIPSSASQYFGFDDRTGNETLYVIQAAKKGSPTLAGIEAASERGAIEPAAAASLLDALDHIAQRREDATSEVVVRRLRLQHARKGEN